MELELNDRAAAVTGDSTGIGLAVRATRAAVDDMARREVNVTGSDFVIDGGLVKTV